MDRRMYTELERAPTSVKSGPTGPPRPRMVWHAAQCVSKSVLPRATSCAVTFGRAAGSSATVICSASSHEAVHIATSERRLWRMPRSLRQQEYTGLKSRISKTAREWTMRISALGTAILAYVAIGHALPAAAQVDQQRAQEYFKEAQVL